MTIRTIAFRLGPACRTRLRWRRGPVCRTRAGASASPRSGSSGPARPRDRLRLIRAPARVPCEPADGGSAVYVAGAFRTRSREPRSRRKARTSRAFAVQTAAEPTALLATRRNSMATGCQPPGSKRSARPRRNGNGLARCQREQHQRDRSGSTPTPQLRRRSIGAPPAVRRPLIAPLARRRARPPRFRTSRRRRSRAAVALIQPLQRLAATAAGVGARPVVRRTGGGRSGPATRASRRAAGSASTRVRSRPAGTPWSTRRRRLCRCVAGWGRRSRGTPPGSGP